MADAAGLNPAAARHVGSNPAPGTTFNAAVVETREGSAPGAGGAGGRATTTQSRGWRVEHLSWDRRRALGRDSTSAARRNVRSYDDALRKLSANQLTRRSTSYGVDEVTACLNRSNIVS